MTNLADSLRTDLTDGLQRFNQALADFGERMYRLYQSNPQEAAKEFLRAVRIPHDVQKGFLKTQGQNPGSSAGLAMEWFFFHIINEAIKSQKQSEAYAKKVYNNYPLPFKWAKVSGAAPDIGSHSVTKIDIAVWCERPKRLLYCIEVKTNFEDGFSKYSREWEPIHHLRERSYKPFRYHYVSLSDIPGVMSRKYGPRLKVLEKRREMWIFPKDAPGDTEALERARLFLQALYEPLSYSGRP